MEKHRDTVGEGKGDGHQHGRKPRIQEPVLEAHLDSEEVRGHWTLTGAEPVEQSLMYVVISVYE